MASDLRESVVEEAALAWLEAIGDAIASAPEIAPGEVDARRNDYGQVVLHRWLRQALARLNSEVPADVLDEAFRKLTRLDSPSLIANNHAFHRMFVAGGQARIGTPAAIRDLLLPKPVSGETRVPHAARVTPGDA